VIGPYFFEENNQTVIVDSEHYCKHFWLRNCEG
jgi:hypothetical protein